MRSQPSVGWLARGQFWLLACQALLSQQLVDTQSVDVGKRYIDGERRIKARVLQDYDASTRPVKHQNTTVRVSLGMSLFHILETSWTDEYLQWRPDDYGGIKEIWIPSTKIWRPDITINNNADQQFDSGSNTNCIIQHTGHVLWMFPAVVKTTCTLDVRFFPFDEQRCDIVLISWTYTGSELDLLVDEKNPTANYFQEQNQEWHIKNITAVRKEKFYACCTAPYPDVTFAMRMERRSTFYVMNLVAPCALLYVVSFLSFFLPVESGDKVSVEITILLAMVVFLMVVADTLPPTPDAIPLLGAFFEVTMVMVAVALTMAVIVTNLYFRKDYGKLPPRWLSSICLELRRKRRPRQVTPNDVCRHCGMHVPPERSGYLSDATNESCVCSNNRRPGSGAQTTPVGWAATPDGFKASAEDWSDIAIALDQVFFYMYCLLSIIAFVCVFSRLLDKEDV